MILINLLEFLMDNTLKEIIKNYWEEEGNIISLLQETQYAFGYIPLEAVQWFSEKLGIPLSRFYGVATFYSQFHLNPRGKNILTACSGTACHVKGSERLINCAKAELEIVGEDTTPDMEFTLEKVNCLGACSIAPVFIINKKVYGKMTSDKVIKEIRALRNTKGGKRQD